MIFDGTINCGRDTTARLRLSLLVVVAVIAPPVAVFGGKLLVGIAPVLAAGLVALGWREGKPFVNLTAGLAVVLLGWVGLGLLSLLWSIDPPRTLVKCGDVAAFFVPAVLMFATSRRMAEAERRILAGGVVAGIVLALLFLVEEIATDAYLTRHLEAVSALGNEVLFSPFNRGLSILGLMMWPALLPLLRGGRRLAAALLMGACVAVVWLYFGTSIALDVTIGAVVFGAALVTGRRLLPALAIGVAAWIVFAPLTYHYGLRLFPPENFVNRFENISFVHRLFIWRFASATVLDRPVVGHGLGTARVVPGAHRPVVVQTEPTVVTSASLPIHPHNVPLQLWLELGIPGALLGAGLVLWAVRPVIRRAGRIESAVTSGYLATAFAIDNTSFGVWQAWWLCGLAISALLLVILLPRQDHVTTMEEGPAP